MSSPIQPKADQIAQALAPHLPNGEAPSRTLKGVAKSLRRLANQLTKQQTKQEKAALPTAKKQRKDLAGELITALHPHLGLATSPPAAVPKGIAKAVKQLAGQLLKQRSKQAKQTAKATRKAAKKHSEKPAIPAMLTAPKRSSNGRRPLMAARRAPASKQPASKAVGVAQAPVLALDGVK